MNLNNIIFFRKTLSVFVSTFAILLISATLFTFIALAQVGTARPTSVQVDNFPIATTAENGVIYSNNNTPTFTVTGTIVGAKVRILPGGSNTEGSIDIRKEKEATGTTTTFSYADNPLADGSHTYRANQVVNEVASAFTPVVNKVFIGVLIINTQPPTLTIVNDTGVPNDGITMDGTINVAGILEAGKFEWRKGSSGDYTEVASGNTFVAPSSGTYQVRSIDGSGNRSSVVEIEIVLDNEAPEAPTHNVTFAGSVTNGGTTYLNEGDTISVALNFKEDNIQGIASIQFKNGMENLGTIVATPSERVHTATYTIPAGVNATDGELSFSLANFREIKDVAGNPLAAGFSGDIDNTVIDTTIETPTLELANDYGVPNDFITYDATINVGGFVDSTTTWEYKRESEPDSDYRNGGTGNGSFEALDINILNKKYNVRASDVAGNSVVVISPAITVDTEVPSKPTLALRTDAGTDPNDTITNDPNVLVTGVEAGATWQWSQVGGTYASGTYTSGTTGDGSFEADGVNQKNIEYRAKVIDVAGNESPEGTLTIADLDTTRPSVSVPSFTTTGDIVVGDPAVKYLNFEDDDGGDTVTATYTFTELVFGDLPVVQVKNGTANLRSAVVVKDTTDAKIYTAKYTVVDGDNVDSGNFGFDITNEGSITDVAGNVFAVRGTDTSTIVIDTKDPKTLTIDITAATDTCVQLVGDHSTACEFGDKVDNITRDTTPNFIFGSNLEPNANVIVSSSVTTVDVSGTPTTTTTTQTHATPESDHQRTSGYQSTETLTDEAYTVTATQTDRAGNVSPVSDNFALTIDTVDPSIEPLDQVVHSINAEDDTGVASNDLLTNKGTFTLDVSNTTLDTDRYHATLNIASTRATITPVNSMGKNVGNNKEVSFEFTPNSTDGLLTFSIDFYDIAGNVASVADRKARIDRTTPEATFSLDTDSDSGVEGDRVTNVTTPTLTFENLEFSDDPTEGTGKAKLEVFVLSASDNGDTTFDTNELTPIHTSDNVTGTSLSCTFDSTKVDEDNGPIACSGTNPFTTDGVYKIYTKQTDDAGNVTSTRRDNTAADKLDYNPGTGVKGDNVIIIDTTPPQAPSAPDLDPANDSFGGNPNRSRTGTDQDDNTNQTTHSYFVDASDRQASESVALDGYNLTKEQHHILIGVFTKTDEASGGDDQAYPVIGTPDENDVEDTTVAPASGADPADSEEDRNIDTMTRFADFDEVTKLKTKSRTGNLFTHNFNSVVPEGKDRYVYTVARQRDLAGNVSEYSDIMRVRVDRELPKGVSSQLNLHPARDTGVSTQDGQTSATNPVFRAKFHSDDTRINSLSTDIDYFEIRTVELDESNEFTTIGDFAYLSPTDSASQASHDYLEENTARDIEALEDPYTPGYEGGYELGVTVVVDSLNIPKFNTWYGFKFYSVDLAGNVRPSPHQANLRILVPPPTPGLPNLVDASDTCAEVVVGTPGCQAGNKTDNITSHTTLGITSSFGNGLTIDDRDPLDQQEKTLNAAAVVTKLEIQITPPDSITAEPKSLEFLVDTRGTPRVLHAIAIPSTDNQPYTFRNPGMFNLEVLYPNTDNVAHYYDGDWKFESQAITGAGERGGISEILTVTVDTTPPGNLFVQDGLEVILNSAASETNVSADNFANRHRISCPTGNTLCEGEFPFAVRARHPSENSDPNITEKYTGREVGGALQNRHVTFTKDLNQERDKRFLAGSFYYPDALPNSDETTESLSEREHLRFEVFDVAGNKADEVDVYVPEIRIYEVRTGNFLYFDSLNDEDSEVRGVTYRAAINFGITDRCFGGPDLHDSFSSVSGRGVEVLKEYLREYVELTTYSAIDTFDPKSTDFCLVNVYSSTPDLPKVYRIAQHRVLTKGGVRESVVRQLVSNFKLASGDNSHDTGSSSTDRITSNTRPSLYGETVQGSTEVVFEYRTHDENRDVNDNTGWEEVDTTFDSETGVLQTESLSPALAEGTYNVRVQLRLPESDPANDRTIYTLGNIVIDTTAPTFSFSSTDPIVTTGEKLTNGVTYLNKGDKITLNFTLSESLENQFKVKWLNDGVEFAESDTTGSTDSRTAVLTIADQQNVDKDSLSFRFVDLGNLRDTAGNVMVADSVDTTLPYAIDTIDPKITFLETSGSGGHTYILLISDASEIVKIKKSGEEGPSGNPCRNDIHEDDDHTIGDVISVRDSNRVCVSVEDAAGNIANSITEGNRRTSKTIRGIGNLVIENTLVESGTIYTKPGTFNITGITAGGAKVLFKIADSAPTGNDLQVLATADYSFDTETGKTTFPDGTSLQIEKSSDNGKKLYGWIWLDASDGSTAIPAIDFGTLNVDDESPTLTIGDVVSDAATGSASGSSNTITAPFTTSDLIRSEVDIDFLGVPERDITCTVSTTETAQDSGIYQHSCTIPLTNAEESTGRNAQISITVLDKAGNDATASQDTGLDVDARAPQIRVSFGGYDKVKAGDDISFRVEVVDRQLVSPFVPIEGTLSAGGTISVTQATGDYTYSIPTSATQGPLTIDFPSISDSAGNSVDPEPITIAYIDTKAPTITSASVEGERRSARLSVGVNHGNNSTVPGRETITASFGGDCSEFENDETRDTSDGTSTEAKDYVFTFEAGRGDYSDCTVTVTDGAGNQSTPFTISDSFEVSSGGGGRVGGGGGGSARSFTPITFTVTPAAGREETVEDVITTPTVVPTRILVTGSAGGDVKQVQEKLNQTNCSVAEGSNPGAPGRETTYYGPATERAVACFQRENGIVETGVVDTETRNELFKDDESNKAVIDNLKRILAGLIERLQALQQAQTENSETPEDETEEDEEEENTETPAKRKVEFFPARSPEQDLPFNPFAR